ncbi:MAG: MCE family protein, partial [Solirubrobacterales bacterium]|nr:MCE family protein [Solirubrobacterales bacterium]
MGLMSRFEAIPGQARKRPFRNGMILLVLFGALLAFAFTGGGIPFLPKGGEVVTANFANIANVSPGKTPVRVAGVNVGDVEKVERLPGGRGVKVTMRIEDGLGVKLRRDARAHIYWRTLLGFSFYIQLDEGGAPEPLGETTVAMKDTTTQVELDEVIQALT